MAPLRIARRSREQRVSQHSGHWRCSIKTGAEGPRAFLWSARYVNTVWAEGLCFSKPTCSCPLCVLLNPQFMICISCTQGSSIANGTNEFRVGALRFPRMRGLYRRQYGIILVGPHTGHHSTHAVGSVQAAIRSSEGQPSLTTTADVIRDPSMAALGRCPEDIQGESAISNARHRRVAAQARSAHKPPSALNDLAAAPADKLSTPPPCSPHSAPEITRKDGTIGVVTLQPAICWFSHRPCRQKPLATNTRPMAPPTAQDLWPRVIALLPVHCVMAGQ